MHESQTGTCALFAEPTRDIGSILIEKIVLVEELTQSTDQQDQALRMEPPTESGTQHSERQGPVYINECDSFNPVLRMSMYDPLVKRGVAIGVDDNHDAVLFPDYNRLL